LKPEVNTKYKVTTNFFTPEDSFLMYYISGIFCYFLSLFQAPLNLLKETARLGRLPVVNFAAGGLATPADCSLLMQLGVDGCFVGSGIFKR
jgi:pyridoxal biosynthesis lyase PdxS